MHSFCTVNTCYACSFIVVMQRFHLGGHGQYNDSVLELNEVRHTLDTRDSQGIHRGHLEMTIPQMKSDSIFILSPCMLLLHILKNQLKLHFLTQFSKTLECLCPVSPYMFWSLKADHPRGRMFLSTATYMPCCCSSA
jgi:hypothetical protein